MAIHTPDPSQPANGNPVTTVTGVGCVSTPITNTTVEPSPNKPSGVAEAEAAAAAIEKLANAEANATTPADEAADEVGGGDGDGESQPASEPESDPEPSESKVGKNRKNRKDG